jgi:signal peptidase I
VNFALILFILSALTGGLWALDKYKLRKQRSAGAKEPFWVEYGASLFPVILIVFLLRSFIVEPFKIPSGSMIPTLLVGDFILVNKYTYGIRLPVINKKVVSLNDPQRGDVMVFRYPVDPSVDYIKRVVGTPGDRIAYRGKKLYVNEVEVPVRQIDDFLNTDRRYYSQQFAAKLGETEHRYLNDADATAVIMESLDFPHRENCIYNNAGVECTVPKGHYFMMGDNRDNSRDSRVWGFVPDGNIVGKAFFVWFNFSDLGRVGSFR